MSRAFFPGLLAGLSALAAPTHAQDAYAPDPKFTSTFAENTTGHMCGPDRTVLVAPMLGELAKNFSINVLALPRNPPVRGVEVPDTIEGRVAGWILATRYLDEEQAQRLGLARGQFAALNTIRGEFVEYLNWLAGEPEHPAYRLAPNSLGATETLDQQQAILLRIFAPALTHPGTTRLTIRCADSAPTRIVGQPGQGRDGTRSGTPSPLTVAVRGKIDDLAVPRYDPGTTDLSAASARRARQPSPTRTMT
jgi:hypothetical protein